jgi:hypothetical protein
MDLSPRLKGAGLHQRERQRAAAPTRTRLRRRAQQRLQPAPETFGELRHRISLMQ